MPLASYDKAMRFRALHQGSSVFVMPNPWDAGSARILAGLGFQALATSSGAAAGTLGRRDGRLLRAEALAHARTIVEATELPVSADLEKGFADAPEEVAETVRMAAEVGLVGWTRQVVGGAEQEVLLPLAASQVGEPTPTGPYTLLVQPATELSDLFLTVTRLAADGSAERPVQPIRSLAYGYYPADNPIEIPVDVPAESGLYAVQLGAKLRSGGASTLRFVFYAQRR